MHREILQKLHIDGLRHETSGLCEKTNSIYIVFYLLYTTMSKWSECAHASGVWRGVCARSGSRCIHTGRRRQRLTEGVSEAWCWRAVIVTTTNHILLWCCMNGLGICMRRSDWLTPPLALEKLKSFQLLPRAAPVKQRDGPTIQFANAWRHSIQSQREALTPTPCVNGALVCASAGKRQKWSLVRICHSLPERMHTRHIRVRTQITWTWLCTRGKKRYKYCSFSHTNRSFRVLGHQCVVTMGNCLICISLCMFFFPLIETVTYTCHYMTDRLERFDLKTSKLDLLKKKRHLHLGCPWGKLIDTKF